MGAKPVRKSVPLGQAGLDGVRSLRADVSWREAAMEIAGVGLSPDPSEAEALHALVEVGRRVIEKRVAEAELEAGYAALALTITDEDRAITRAAGLATARRLNDEPYDVP